MSNVSNRPGFPKPCAQLNNAAIFFNHIPKSAGTAVTLRLEPSFHWDECLHSRFGFDTDAVAQMSPSDRLRIKAVMGHISESVREEYFSHCSGVVGLRNPIDRFCSMYKHAARSRSFDPVLHELTVSRDRFFFDRADRREHFRLRVSSLLYLMDLESRRHYVTEEHLPRQLRSALRSLENYALVYTDERIDASAGQISHLLGQPPLPHLPIANEATRFRKDYDEIPLDVPALFARYFPYEQEIYAYAKNRCDECLSHAPTLEVCEQAYSALWQTYRDRRPDFKFAADLPYCGVNWGWRMPGKFEPYLDSKFLRLNGQSGFLDLPLHPDARQIDLILWTNDRVALRAAKLLAQNIPLDVHPQQEGRFLRLRAKLQPEQIGRDYTRITLDVPNAADGGLASVFLYELTTTPVESRFASTQVARTITGGPRASASSRTNPVTSSKHR